MAQLAGWWERRARSVARWHPEGSQVSLRLPSARAWPGHSRGERCRQPLPRSGPRPQRLALPAPEGRPLCPRVPQSRARSRGRGRRAAGLHLLDQAPALGGLAQEPPVVVGVGCGPIRLLLGGLRGPAPARETPGRGVRGATAGSASPPTLLGGPSSPHLPPSPVSEKGTFGTPGGGQADRRSLFSAGLQNSPELSGRRAGGIWCLCVSIRAVRCSSER